MAENLGKLLSTALDQETLTDVLIIARDKVEIQAHRLVLALASSELKKLLYVNNGLPPAPAIIVLTEDAFVVQSIVNYIYKGEIPNATKNIEMFVLIFEAAKKYKVLGMAEATMEVLVPSIDSKNIFQILNVAEEINVENLVSITWEYIQNKTAEVLETNLEEINVEILTRILKDDFLTIEEIELFKLLLRWADKNCQNGVRNKSNLKKVLGSSLKLIRFPTMSAEEFANVVVPTGHLSESQATKILLYIASSNDNRKKIAMAYPTEARKTRKVSAKNGARGCSKKKSKEGQCCDCDEDSMMNFFGNFGKLREGTFFDIRKHAEKLWINFKSFMSK